MTNNKWRIEVQGGGQIADTGDYSDPIYVLTNGDIELVTKDEIEDVDQEGLLSWLNDLNVKWEDWKLSDKEFELHLKQQEVDKWKEMAQDMYLWLDAYMHSRPTIDKSHPVNGLIYRYEELEKNMP